MAERCRYTWETSNGIRTETINEARYSEELGLDDHLSHSRSRNRSPNGHYQTHTSEDDDQTNRPMDVVDHTCDQTVPDEKTSDLDTQLAAASNLNIVGSNDPVMLGAGCNVYKGCTIDQHQEHHQHQHQHQHQHHHHHHHHHYYNSCPPLREQNPEILGTGSSCLGLPPCPTQHPGCNQTEDNTSKSEDKKDKSLPQGEEQMDRKRRHPSDHHSDSSSSHPPFHRTVCSHDHNNDHTPLSTNQTFLQRSGSATPNSSTQSTQRELSQRRDDDRERARMLTSSSVEQVYQTVPATTTYRASVLNNECVMDSGGRALEPGDGVWLGKGYGYDNLCGVYVGNQEVVMCARITCLVRKQYLEMTEQFQRLTVCRRGDVCEFPPREKVKRAESHVGREFTEGGGGRDVEFLFWVCTGMSRRQAVNRGFWFH